MKLQQLRYVLEVYKQNLNVSLAADILYTSQPGVSKQIRLLEDELGIQIFIRQGKRIVSVTEPGLSILGISEKILREVSNIKKIGEDYSSNSTGILSIATTSTQAKYVLPKIIKRFCNKYKDVEFQIKFGGPTEICQFVEDGIVDVGLTTEWIKSFPDLVFLPCYEWNRSIVVPKEHELSKLDSKTITLDHIARYPLVTYDFSFVGDSSILKAFNTKNMQIPKVVVSSSDTDVLKSYVRLGIGIGLMASIAYDPIKDNDLTFISCSHLFDSATVGFIINQDRYLKGYIYDFIEMVSPELTKDKVNCILSSSVQAHEDYSI